MFVGSVVFILFVVVNMLCQLLIVHRKGLRIALLWLPASFTTINFAVSGVVILLHFLWIPYAFSVPLVYIGLIGLVTPILLSLPFRRWIVSRMQYFRSNNEWLLWISVVVISCILSLVIFYWRVAPGSTLNTDSLAHLTVIKEIFNNGHIHWQLRG